MPQIRTSSVGQWSLDYQFSSQALGIEAKLQFMHRDVTRHVILLSACADLKETVPTWLRDKTSPRSMRCSLRVLLGTDSDGDTSAILDVFKLNNSLNEICGFCGHVNCRAASIAKSV
jgi:hypothetical protein